jgi:hypothetical protein
MLAAPRCDAHLRANRCLQAQDPIAAIAADRSIFPERTGSVKKSEPAVRLFGVAPLAAPYKPVPRQQGQTLRNDTIIGTLLRA